MHNPFQFIGKTDAEVCEKIQNAYAQLFQGDSENEYGKVYRYVKDGGKRRYIRSDDFGQNFSRIESAADVIGEIE